MVILECIQDMEEEDNIAMLLPTSPLRQPRDITSALEIFKDCNSVISVTEYNKPVSCLRYIVDDFITPIVQTDCFEIQRQDIKKVYEVNGSIYISSVGNLKVNKSFHIGKVKPYIMDKLHSVDINTMEDFKLAEGLLSVNDK